MSPSAPPPLSCFSSPPTMSKKRVVHIQLFPSKVFPALAALMPAALAHWYAMLVVVTVLALVPWPGSLPPRPPCPREKAALVRKVLEKRWLPVLERVGAFLPLECPLHPARDVFAEQEAHKRHDEPRWLCAYCGKAFYREEHLDRHLESRHSDHLNEREDSVCLADYCDVMRCEVLQQRPTSSTSTPAPLLPAPRTALDVWTQHAVARQYGGAERQDEQCEGCSVPRSVLRPPQWQPWRRPPPPTPAPPSSQPPINPSEEGLGRGGKRQCNDNCRDEEINAEEASTARTDSFNEGPGERQADGYKGPAKERPEDHSGRSGVGGPRELPLHPLHSWKDTCNEEHLSELRAKCQMLIQHCIAGLVLNLTLDQVRDVETALQRSVCWYLTCERYWEASSVDELTFPWWLLTGAVLLLTLGVSMAYYLVWGLTESQEGAISPTSATSTYPYLTSSSPYPNYLTAPNSQMGTNLHPTNSAYHYTQPMAGGASGASHGPSNQVYLSGAPGHAPQSPMPGYTSYSVMSGSSRRRKMWAAGNDSESECRDSGFNEGPLGGDLSTDEAVSALTPYDLSGGGRARHYSADSRPSSSAGGAVAADESGRLEDRQFNYASSFTPNYEQRRMRRNRYNYLDDFDAYSEVEADHLDSASLSRERSDSFIYVAYPPEVKRRFLHEGR